MLIRHPFCCGSGVDLILETLEITGGKLFEATLGPTAYCIRARPRGLTRSAREVIDR